MKNHKIVSREGWLKAREEFLLEEKEFTKLHDKLSSERRELPWVKVEKEYAFDTTEGKEDLADLFEGKSQLIVYHFMFGPDWPEGCPSCSFWADNFNNIVTHLNHRDMNLIAISKAPVDKLLDYKNRMGWSFKWVSSFGNEFNEDYNVTFTKEQIDNNQAVYNYGHTKFSGEEAPGISVFYKNDNGEIFHTYSCYARGLDMLNGAYHFMDLAPKGRDEDDLPFTMAWLKRHDQY